MTKVLQQAQYGGIPRGHIAGMILSNNASDATNDIDFSAGECLADDQSYLMRTTSTFTKRLDAAWASGSGNGGLDQGSVSDGTFHCMAIFNPTTGATDFLFYKQGTTLALPSGWIAKRRLGSIIRSTSILPFWQLGDNFNLKSVGSAFIGNSLGTSGVLQAVGGIPLGIEVIAKLYVAVDVPSGSTVVGLISSPSDTDEAPGSANSNVGTLNASSGTIRVYDELHVKTNTSGQVRYRFNASNSSIYLTLAGRGWIDTRGRFD